jgi:uncharacterized protein YecT (DUF1311 family)
MLAPVSLAVLLLGSPAPASRTVEAHYSAEFKSCVDHADGADPAFVECTDAEFDRWDKELNRVYAQVMAAKPPAQRTALRKAERAWITDTKRRCDHAGDDNEGGTAQQVEISSCYLEQTTLRVLQLKAELQRK